MTKRYSRIELVIEDFDDCLVVDFNYYSGTPMTMYARNGDPGEPGDPPEIEILSALHAGIDISATLSSDAADRLEAACFEYVEGDD